MMKTPAEVAQAIHDLFVKENRTRAKMSGVSIKKLAGISEPEEGGSLHFRFLSNLRDELDYLGLLFTPLPGGGYGLMEASALANVAILLPT
jgi:hypothetical protein